MTPWTCRLTPPAKSGGTGGRCLPLGQASRESRALDSPGDGWGPVIGWAPRPATGLAGQILGLVIAAILLVGAVQCSFNARQYIWSAADVLTWWPDVEEDSPREARLRAEQDLAFGRWRVWVKWARITYDIGILALLAAPGLEMLTARDLPSFESG